MTLEMSETRANSRRLYVDSGAAENGADGSAQKPFRDIESALAELLPTPDDFDPQTDLTSLMTELKEIELSGYFPSITIDRPCIISGKAPVGELTITAPLCFLQLANIGTLVNGVALLIVAETNIEDWTVGAATIQLRGCVMGALTLDEEDAGTIEFTNCLVREALTIPEGWTAEAYNSSFTGVTGTITLVNSDDGNGS